MARSEDLDGQDEEDRVLQRKANRSTILGVGLSRRTLVWTIAAVGVALVGFLASVVVSKGGNQQTTTIQGDNNTVIQNLKDFQNSLPSDASPSLIREESRRYAQQRPEGSGPWPFVVVADPLLGLKIRTSGLIEGGQVGSATYKAPLWADCQQDTGFNPIPGDPNGSVWYRVRWPNNEPTTQFFNSAPGDRFSMWAYGGLIVPVGHNGQIPECP